MLRRVMIGLAAVAAFALPAAAQDHYVIGLTGAMTGPAAGSLAPAVEGVRIYVDRLNAAGGINGKKVELILQDDAAEPSKKLPSIRVFAPRSLMCEPPESGTSGPKSTSPQSSHSQRLLPSTHCTADGFAGTGAAVEP